MSVIVFLLETNCFGKENCKFEECGFILVVLIRFVTNKCMNKFRETRVYDIICSRKTYIEKVILLYVNQADGRRVQVTNKIVKCKNKQNLVHKVESPAHST